MDNSDSRHKFMQDMCNAANKHIAGAKERIEKEYGFIAGVDAMLWSIQNYFQEEAEKMERNEEESQEENK